MEQPSDGQFAGIDPQQMAQLMQSLNSAANTGQQTAGNYLTQFQRLGLDTGAVTKLRQDYAWAAAQQPMLQRRSCLASNQPSGDWQGGYATAGAGDLQWSSNAQAQAAGAQASEQYHAGKMTYQQYTAELEENQNDPAWATGAMKALGHDGLQALEAQIPGADPEALQALANATAAAMANGVTFPVADNAGHEEAEDPVVLAPLVKLAQFPPSALVTIANQAVQNASTPDGSGQYWQTTVAPILQALADNPEASAQFLAQFQKAQGEPLGQYLDSGNGVTSLQAFENEAQKVGMPLDIPRLFAHVITAGTSGAQSVDPKLAAANVTSLVQFYYQNPGAHTYPEIQAAYGKIVTSYWPDVAYAITTDTPQDAEQGLGMPDGIKAGPDQWAAFIDEAMRDPKTAALLMSNARAQAQAMQQSAARQSGSTGSAYAFRAGQIDGFFDYQAMTAYQSLEADNGGDPAASAWQAQVPGDLVGMVFDVAADPAAAGVTIPVDIGNDVIQALIGFFQNNVQTGAKPVSPQYSTWQQALSYQAIYDFNESTPQLLASDPNRAGFVNSANNFDGGSFVQDGQIMDPAKMNAAQRAAYDQWLNDPATVGYIENQQFGNYENGYSTWWNKPSGN